MHLASIVALPLAAAVLLTPLTPAGAAITEKVAIKQVKTAVKTRLGICRSALDGARTQLLGRLDAFDVAVASGSFTVLAAQGLADDLAAFQAAVQVAVLAVARDISIDGNVALAALADGTPLATLPRALANVPGALPDQARASVGKLLSKTYRGVNMRLVKTSALVEKASAASLIAALDAPATPSFCFSEFRNDASFSNFGIDLRVAASTRTPDQTRLWVGGTTGPSGRDVNVIVLGQSEPLTIVDDQVKTASGGRFVVPFGEAVTLPRTNYLLIATTVADGPTASSALALR